MLPRGGQILLQRLDHPRLGQSSRRQHEEGRSMRPPFVRLVSSLQHMDERRPHKFEGNNMLENKMVK